MGIWFWGFTDDMEIKRELVKKGDGAGVVSGR
jgi:hypothetical protein